MFTSADAQRRKFFIALSQANSPMRIHSVFQAYSFAGLAESELFSAVFQSPRIRNLLLQQDDVCLEALQLFCSKCYKEIADRKTLGQDPARLDDLFRFFILESFPRHVEASGDGPERCNSLFASLTWILYSCPETCQQFVNPAARTAFYVALDRFGARRCPNALKCISHIVSATSPGQELHQAALNMFGFECFVNDDAYKIPVVREEVERRRRQHQGQDSNTTTTSNNNGAEWRRFPLVKLGSTHYRFSNKYDTSQQEDRLTTRLRTFFEKHCPYNLKYRLREVVEYGWIETPELEEKYFAKLKDMYGVDEE